MRAIAVAALFGVACWGDQTVRLTVNESSTQPSSCDVPVELTGQLPAGPLMTEHGTAQIRSQSEDLRLYLADQGVSFTVDQGKKIRFELTARRFNGKDLEGDIELTTESPQLAGIRFIASFTGAALRIGKGSQCPVVISNKPSTVRLKSAHIWLSQIHPNLWQVAGTVEAEDGGGGPVTIEGDGWTHDLTVGAKPAVFSDVFPASRRVEKFNIKAGGETLLSVVPEPVSPESSGRLPVEWIALALAMAAGAGTLLMWLRGRNRTDDLEELRTQLEIVRSTRIQPVQPAAPASPQTLSKAMQADLQKIFDLRYATVSDVTAAVQDRARELKSLRESLGDVQALGPDWTPSAAPAPQKPATFSASDRFCAAVNEWLAGGGRSSNRASLVARLSDFGLQAAFASLERIEEANQDLANPLTLTPGPDGWWVLARLEGRDCFVCPLDSSYFSQANLPLVGRWYEGLSLESKPLRFLRRPATVTFVRDNTYRLKTKGSLDYVAPDGATPDGPADYKAVIASLSKAVISEKPYVAPRSSTPTLAGRLASHDAKLVQLEQKLNLMSGYLEQSPQIEARLAAKIDELRTQVLNGNRKFEGEVTQRLRAIEQRPVVAQVQASPAPAPVAESQAPPAETRTKVEPLARVASASAGAGAGAAEVSTPPRAPIRIPVPRAEPAAPKAKPISEVEPTAEPGVDWPAVFKQAAMPIVDAEHGSPEEYLDRLKQIAALANGQILRGVRRDDCITAIELDQDQIPADRNVYLMVVGRLRKDRCWEVVLPKGEIRVDNSRPVLDFLLPGTPASLIVGGVLQPAIWEPKGSGFAVRQYLQLDSSTL